MEIKTCEQYVLAELAYAKRENEKLRAKVEELQGNTELESNESQTISDYCLAIGKRKVADDAVRSWRCDVVQDGRIITYSEWIASVVRNDSIPPIATRREFLTCLRPYLMDIYEEKLNEHRDEVKDE